VTTAFESLGNCFDSRRDTRYLSGYGKRNLNVGGI
jgi:hypothetical protein